MAKVSIDYEFDNCRNCPYLRTAKTYGNNGRDGDTVYICDKGCFGRRCLDGYNSGLQLIPTEIPYGCPFRDRDETIDKLLNMFDDLPSNKKTIILDVLSRRDGNG